MVTQIWIVGQIIVDIIMVALLLWFVRFNFKRRTPWKDYETVFQKSETILSEMRTISHELEQNLQEKKDLSRDILKHLEQGLRRAEKSCEQIRTTIPKPDLSLSDQPGPRTDTNQTRSSVKALLGKGLPKEEIARHLGISVGEIELLLKLQPKG